MRRVLWFGAWAAVACWSLVALVAYGLLDAFGSLAMRNADAFSSDPDTVVWIFQVFGWIRSLSTSIALVIWGVVSLAILAVPWLLDRLVGRSLVIRTGTSPFPQGAAQGPFGGGPFGGGPFGRGPFQPSGAPPFGAPRREDGVIDLDPDQYTVRPAGGTPGQAPRITPRP